MRNIRAMLSEIDRKDCFMYCKADYDAAIKQLKRQKYLWSPELFKETIAITLEFFDTCPFHRLPEIIMIEIFLWLPENSIHSILSVCTTWKSLGMSNEMWNMLYQRKFLLNNARGTIPNIRNDRIFSSYRQRLLCPEVGDKVEVAWRGKFRLETQDVYQGLAWWVAEIVDKNLEQNLYKIRYPGWESRWDEWVPRVRLRWMVRSNTIESIAVGDVVELWCVGTNVPGAWLETKVKKTRDNRYCLGKVLSSGSLWVDRNRIRLVRKGNGIYHSLEANDSGIPVQAINRSTFSPWQSFSSFFLPRQTSQLPNGAVALPIPVDRANTLPNIQVETTTSTSCVVM